MQVLRLIALGRTALGVVALTMPQVPARPWVGREAASSTAGQVMARALGARDLVLGVGAFVALGRGSQGQVTAGRDWAMAGVVADGLDALVTASAFGRLPKYGRWLVLSSASASALAGIVSSGRLGRK